MASNEDHVNRYLLAMERTMRRQPLTIYKYRQYYASLLSDLNVPLAAVSVAELEQWLGRERTGRCSSGIAAPATLKTEIGALKSLFKWLHAQGITPTNPAAKLTTPEVHNDEPKPITHELWSQVWSSPLAPDERVALGLAYYCGLRRHEVTSLRPEQFVDVPAPMIMGLKRKGGKKQGFHWRSCIELYVQRLPHLLPDPSTFVDPLLQHIAMEGNSLLPWSRSGGAVWPVMFNKRVDGILLRLGLPPHAFSPHNLRHSFCSNLCQVKVPIHVVARLAGHSSMNITQRYVDAGEDPLDAFLTSDTPLRSQEGAGGLMKIKPDGSHG